MIILNEKTMLAAFSLFVILSLSACSNSTNYFVSSNQSAQCLMISNDSEYSCKTFDEYANNKEWLNGRKKADVLTLTFLQGVHNLSRNLTLHRFGSITIKGQKDYPDKQADLILHKCNITVQNVTQFTMSDLSINGLSFNCLSVKEVSHVTIKNVVITSSALLIRCFHCNSATVLDTIFIGSVLVVAWPDYMQKNPYSAYENVTVKGTVFYLSSVGNGISCCNVNSLTVVNVFMGNIHHDMYETYPPRVGFVSTFCHHFPWGLRTKEECDLLTSSIDRLIIHNSTFKRNSSTGLCIKVPTGAFVSIKSTAIVDHTRGGIKFSYDHKGMRIFLHGNNISNNINTWSSSSEASALSIYNTFRDSESDYPVPKLYLFQTKFTDNRHVGNTLISTVSITSYIQTSISNCEFTGNYGSAITAHTTGVENIVIAFGGTIIFRNNTSHRGGAIHLFKSNIGLKKGVDVIFEQNTAKDVGGAIYVHSTKWLTGYYGYINQGTLEHCFYILMDCNIDYHFNLTFKNNTALNGGEHIFGAALISSCTICYKRSLAPTVNDNIFTFSNPTSLTFSPISSFPSRVCICGGNLKHYNPHYFCSNTSHIFLSKSVYPGEEFSFEAVLAGAEFGTGTGSVYAQFLSQSSSKLYPPHQYSQRVDDFRKCTLLSYTVHSSNSHDVLMLTSNDQTVLQYGNQEEIQQDSDSYINEILLKDIPPNLLTTTVYINLTLLPCPLGFHLVGSPPKCDCLPPFTASNMFCNFTNGIGYIYRNDTTWIGTLNESAVLIQAKCPFDYCIAELTGVDLEHPDAQCAMNHSGILCGGCRKGFSMALGTNMCLPCENNNHLGLVIFFTFAGLLLVVFIKVFNMTVSQGTINGLIFYANIVWAYQDVVFPKRATSRWFIFLRVFVAWLNLDLGIKTCFVQGMSSYAKTWIQFLFPIYLWSIAGIMVIAAHYSTTLTKLFGNNCVQVLATLFLLSYAKLLRAIITVIIPAVISVYPFKGFSPTDVKVVWAFDGNLSYCGNPHVFLFIVALSILICLWVPYTVLLLSFRTVTKTCSSVKCLKWISRLTPFIETYFGPFKISHSYWVGLLLLVRGILFTVLTLTYTTAPSASLLSLVIASTTLFVLLVHTGKVYQNWPLSLLECSFFVNLQVLCTFTLFIDIELDDANKEMAVNISVGITFVQFLGITLFHLCQLIYRKCGRKCCSTKLTNLEIPIEKQKTNRYYKFELMDNGITNKGPSSNAEYLEDYAINADIGTQ